MSSKRGIDFLKAVAEYMVKTNSFDSVTKSVEITGGGDGRCVAELTVTKDHLNMNGSLHIGFTTTIIDLMTTYALTSCPSQPGVSVDIHVRNIQEAKEGEVLIIDANTVNAGNNVCYIECELRRKNDNVVIARGAQTKFLTPKAQL